MSVPSMSSQCKRTDTDSNFTPWVLYFALGVILLRVASGMTANLSYLLLAIYALFGRTQTIQALTLSWLLTMLNPGLASDSDVTSIGRYLVIFAAAVSMSWRCIVSKRTSINRLCALTFLFGTFLLAHSIFFSKIVDVSILKSLSWITVVITLLSAWHGLSHERRMILFDQLQFGLTAVVLLSLPLLAVPNIGYLRNGTGFQGVLNHPQAFGATVALAGAIAGARVMGERKPCWRDIALVGFCLMLVILSEARTAGISMVIGLVSSAVLSPMFAGVSRRRMLPGLRSRRFYTVSVLVLIGVFTGGPFVIGPLTNYLLKRSEATDLISAADASRGALIQEMLANIKEKPLSGIGFGIASNSDTMEVERDSALGLPLSAQVEKGVMPFAVMEELGVFGSMAVFAWILAVLRKGARSGVPQFAVLITLLLVNLGEFMFFSVNGMGMLLLVFLTGAVTTQQLKKSIHA